MFYIKVHTDILKDSNLNLLDKLVLSHLLEIWENTGKTIKTLFKNNNLSYTLHDNKYIGLLKISVSNASKELNISRASYYRSLNNLIKLDYINFIGSKGAFTIIEIYTCHIQNYVNANNIIDQLKNKWHKNS